MMRKTPLTLCVVGAGFTGAAAAIACLQRIDRPFRLVVIGPSAALGRGVAYGAHHPLHLLNVRTRDLSVRARQPGDFLNWAFRQLDQGENHPGLHEGLAHTFLPRQLFGEYVRQRFFEAVAQRPDVEVKLLDDVAEGFDRTSNTFQIATGSERVAADVVLLATAYGLARPTLQGALPPFGIPSEFAAKARSVALIGSGLTMVDVLLDLRRDGYQGLVKVISRRGLLPRPHAAKGVVPQTIGLPRSKRISALVAGVSLACAAAEAHGTPWQAIINGLRSSLQDIWLSLSCEEQSRFLRHVRPLWDVHRHRLPIEVHARLLREFSEGRAILRKGRVSAVERGPDGFILTLNGAGTREERLEADLAVDCTGHRPDLEQPFMRTLLHRGLGRPDPHGLGLSVLRNGQVLGKDSIPTPGLFALGPLCQGSLWEITSVPEIVAQCDGAAQAIAGRAESSHREAALSAEHG